MDEAHTWEGGAFHAGADIWMLRSGEQGQDRKARPERAPGVQAELF